jgi:anti-sigma B factor antagonist
MSQSLASIDVRIVDDKTSVIAIRGVLSWPCERSLMDAYVRACAPTCRTDDAEAISRSPTAIVCDLSQLEYLNSSGIGLLIMLLVRMNRQRQRLLAYGFSEHCQQILAITRLDEVIRTFNTESEALAAAAQL